MGSVLNFTSFLYYEEVVSIGCGPGGVGFLLPEGAFCQCSFRNMVKFNGIGKTKKNIYLCPMPELKNMSIRELEKLLQAKMDEVYRIRMEISKKRGDVPGSVDVDYEKYVTK